MEFYNNKKNDTLKFKLNAEGIDMSDIEARLVFKGSDNKSMLLIGAIREGYCIFDVPELKMYEKDDQGDVKFEVIAGDVYFQPWKNSFNIKTQASMKVEEVIETVLAKEKEKPSISASVEIVPKKEYVTKKEIPAPVPKKKILFESKQEVVEEEIKITPELNPYKDIKDVLKEEFQSIKEDAKDDNEDTLTEIPDFKHFRMKK